MKKILSKTKITRVKKAREKTKEKISKHWEKYRKNRSEANRFATQDLISKEWNTYRSKKYSIVTESPFTGLIPERKVTTTGTKQEYYKLRKDTELNDVFDDILEGNRKIRYIQVIFKIRTKEGLVQNVSDVFTEEAYYNLQELDIDIFDSVVQKLSFVQKYSGYELLSQHIRIIYENFKTDKKTKDKRT